MFSGMLQLQTCLGKEQGQGFLVEFPVIFIGASNDGEEKFPVVRSTMFTLPFCVNIFPNLGQVSFGVSQQTVFHCERGNLRRNCVIKPFFLSSFSLSFFLLVCSLQIEL